MRVLRRPGRTPCPTAHRVFNELPHDIDAAWYSSKASLSTGFELPRRRDGREVAPLLDEQATSDAIRTLITRIWSTWTTPTA